MVQVPPAAATLPDLAEPRAAAAAPAPAGVRGADDGMKLQYFQAQPGNFGDDLNAWLWPRVLGDAVRRRDDLALVGIGSILDERYRDLAGKKIVFGSGARRRSTVPKLDRSWDIRFVRGPLTAAALELDAAAAVTDGAVALTGLKLERVGSTEAIGFMPHYRTLAAADWEKVCARAGVRLIDPTRPVPEVLHAVGSVDRLITEALHGAIVADVLRVPWLRVQCHSHYCEGSDVSAFKWEDWGASLGVATAAEPFALIRPVPRFWVNAAATLASRSWERAALPAALARLAACARFRLSPASALNAAAERIATHVARLREELLA